MDIIGEENKSSLTKSGRYSDPKAIRKALDDYIIGQDHAKGLSVAVHNHYKRLKHQAGQKDVELAKSNILLMAGPVPGRHCWRRRWRAFSTFFHHCRCDDAHRSRLCRRGR